MAHDSSEPGDIQSAAGHEGRASSSRAKRFRRILVLLLAAAVLSVEAGIVYSQVFFSSPFYPGPQVIDGEWNNGYLQVRRILDPSRAGALRKGDRIVSFVIGGREFPAGSPAELDRITKTIRFGEAFQVKVLRTGAEGHASVRVLEFSAVPRSAGLDIWHRLARAASSIVIFLACLTAALLIGLARPEDERAFAASLLFFCFGVIPWHGDMAMFPPLFRNLGYALWLTLLAFVTPALLWFCLRFPAPSPVDRRFPWLKRAGVEFGAVFAVWNGILWFLQQSDRDAYSQYLGGVRYADWALDVVFCLIAVAGLASLISNARHAPSQDERRRLRILLCGILGFFPWLTSYLHGVTIGGKDPVWVGILVTLALLLFPLCFLYAVLRHRVFGIRVFLRRGLQFALLSKGFLVLEGAAIFVVLYYAAGPSVARIAGRAHGGAVAVAMAGMAVVGVIGIRKVNGVIMEPVERRFFREAYDARRVLTGLTVDLRRLVGDLDALAWTVVDTVSRSLHPADTSVFLRADALAGLPLSGERRHAILRGAKEAPADSFLCFWRRHPGVRASGADSGGAQPLHLPAGSSVLSLLTGKDVSSVSLDPKERQSAAGALDLHGTPEEKDVLARTLEARLLLPLSAGGSLLGFLALGEKLSQEPYSREDIDLLRALALQMADTLDHARLLHESEKQAQILREVEIAQQVQRNLLPRDPPALPGLDCAGACRPARYVGGDYFDFIRAGDHHLALALGDISGKGISAALLMASLQATLREQADSHGREPASVLRGVNRRLCMSAGEGRFATLFYAMLDTQTLALDYASAGHNPPALFRRSAGGGQVVRLGATGTLAGIFDDTEYSQSRVQLQAGDLLVIFSDGVTEAMNENAEFYEESRLLNLLPSLADLPAQTVLDRILDEVARFAGEAPQADDITLIVVRVL